MVVNSRFTDVNYVTLLLHNKTAGQSYILRSHFRKYILLGSTAPLPAQFNNGGCPLLACLPCPCPPVLPVDKPVDNFLEKSGGLTLLRADPNTCSIPI